MMILEKFNSENVVIGKNQIQIENFSWLLPELKNDYFKFNL